MMTLKSKNLVQLNDSKPEQSTPHPRCTSVFVKLLGPLYVQTVVKILKTKQKKKQQQ